MRILFARDDEEMSEIFPGTEYAIRSSLKYSGKRHTTLLGCEKQRTDLCDYAPIKDYSKTKDLFFSKYYKHKSIHSERFIRLTLSNFFYYYDFCEKNGITEPLCVLDTDVLVFCDLELERQPFLDYDFTISKPQGQHDQTPIYFNNPSVLGHFIDFLFGFYSFSNPKFINFFNVTSEICPMALWSYFKNMYYWNRVGNTAEIKEKWEGSLAWGGYELTTFDHNLSIDYEGYEHNGKKKVVKFIGDRPYIYNKNLNKNVRFNILHCWSQEDKAHMREILI